MSVTNVSNIEFKSISIDLLELDSFNPRLPKSMHGKGEAEIIKYMLLDASLIELMLAIGENGFFPGEQLLVVKNNEKYKVIEGNRRLSAVKLLHNPSIADVQTSKINKVLQETSQRPDTIPCLIFSTEESISNYLGYRHITGIKEWKLLEKARYLNRLRSTDFSQFNVDNAAKEIAKIIGSRKDYVKRLLVGFEVYKFIEDEGFYKIRDLNDTSFHFNYIADSLNGKENISNFLGVNLNNENPIHNLKIENLKKWTLWLFEKNSQNKTRLIGDSSDLNSLNTVLGNDQARLAFDERGYTLERAKELTEEIGEQFMLSISKAGKLLEDADKLVIRVNNFYPSVYDDLKNIRLLASKISRSVQDKEDENDN